MTDEDLKRFGDLMDSKIKQLSDSLNHPETGLKGLNTKLEDIAAELSEVHKLASSTYDIARLESQIRKQEINEIREHVGLPPLAIDL